MRRWVLTQTHVCLTMNIKWNSIVTLRVCVRRMVVSACLLFLLIRNKLKNVKLELIAVTLFILNEHHYDLLKKAKIVTDSAMRCWMTGPVHVMLRVFFLILSALIEICCHTKTFTYTKYGFITYLALYDMFSSLQNDNFFLISIYIFTRKANLLYSLNIYTYNVDLQSFWNSSVWIYLVISCGSGKAQRLCEL